MRLSPVLAVLGILTLQPAFACAVAEDFHVTDIAFGPVVVVASVTEYRVERGAGLLTLDVTEIWKGTAPGRLTARWGETMAELPPADWSRPDSVIAAISPGAEGFDLVVRMCGSAHLVPDTPEARAAIRAALAP
jgi:hypothetical protein